MPIAGDVPELEDRQRANHPTRLVRLAGRQAPARDREHTGEEEDAGDGENNGTDAPTRCSSRGESDTAGRPRRQRWQSKRQRRRRREIIPHRLTPARRVTALPQPIRERSRLWSGICVAFAREIARESV